ncbi:hypothetical protein J2751_002856 [Halorubrum alkaliphilum]|uniref:Uncharacterized protein n=1 Tax=Halorubrum alkaliphilum TaxID=261290 RepID=A0A8T4GK91_9EURY|nr:DUF6517 family protein [Halorubrum alkaliphilum]MBP1923811.1 hypothetical protein [Halorubrum alkaliphilum]
MSTRRRFLAAGITGVTVAVSGCADAIEVATEEEIERSAEPTEPDQRTAEEEGFEEVRSETVVIEEEFEELGQRREFTARTEVRAYLREVQSDLTGQEESVFAVVSTPGVTAAGQQLSPLANMDEDELIDEARGEISTEFSGTVEDPVLDEEIEQEVFGETADVSVYEATVVLEDGTEEQGYLHLSVVERGDDVVLLAGAYPADVEGERERIERLFESVE